MFQSSLTSLESSNRQTSSQVAQLQGKVDEYERLLEDNRNQVSCCLSVIITCTVNL